MTKTEKIIKTLERFGWRREFRPGRPGKYSTYIKEGKEPIHIGSHGALLQGPTPQTAKVLPVGVGLAMCGHFQATKELRQAL